MTHPTIDAHQKARRKLSHRKRIIGMAAALIATANWCHPPIPDINFFHRSNNGPRADATFSISSEAV